MEIFIFRFIFFGFIDKNRVVLKTEMLEFGFICEHSKQRDTFALNRS